MLDQSTKKVLFARLTKKHLVRLAIFLVVIASCYTQASDTNEDKDDIINQYIESKGYSSMIVFDNSNIKQFWVDKSVAVKNKSIEIFLKPQKDGTFESILFPIQLSNVNPSQDCKIDVISDSSDLTFTVSTKAVSFKRKNNEFTAESTKEEDFIQYHINSCLIHLDKTESFSISIKFFSKGNETVRINKIVLSFSENKDSFFKNTPNYNDLLNLFKEKGTSVPDYDIQYIIENKIIYIKLPTQQISSYAFFYHVYPLDKENLFPDKTYNNMDSTINNGKDLTIPRPYSIDKEHNILRLKLPDYQCKKIDIGQFENIKLWQINILDYNPEDEK